MKPLPLQRATSLSIVKSAILSPYQRLTATAYLFFNSLINLIMLVKYIVTLLFLFAYYELEGEANYAAVFQKLWRKL